MHNFSNIKIERSKRKSLIIKVLPDSSVVIKAPFLVPKFFIDKFIYDHKDWINKQIEKYSKMPIALSKKYEHGEQFLYLGKFYELNIGSHLEICISDNEILFPRALAFRIKKEIDFWYQKQAKKIISEQVKTISKQMKLDYGEIIYSDTRSKWGSCSHDNNLQFNWRLIMAPLLVINYVIIHELAHIKEKNHSREFWLLVEKYNPSYRQQRLWLKKHGHTLVL